MLEKYAAILCAILWVHSRSLCPDRDPRRGNTLDCHPDIFDIFTRFEVKMSLAGDGLSLRPTVGFKSDWLSGHGLCVCFF